MLDVILSLLGNAANGGLGATKFTTPERISKSGVEGFSFQATEHREGFAKFLAGIGLLAPPSRLTYIASESSVSVNITSGKDESPLIITDLTVARTHVMGVVRTYNRPNPLPFVIVGVLTFFTIIGPIICFLAYKNTKHTGTFGYDTDGDIGLVIHFTGSSSLKDPLDKLLRIGGSYLLGWQDSAPVASMPSVPSLTRHSLDLPADPDPLETYEPEPGKLLARIGGNVMSVTKTELKKMARQGEISPADKVSTDGTRWLDAGKVRGLFS